MNNHPHRIGAKEIAAAAFVIAVIALALACAAAGTLSR